MQGCGHVKRILGCLTWAFFIESFSQIDWDLFIILFAKIPYQPEFLWNGSFVIKKLLLQPIPILYTLYIMTYGRGRFLGEMKMTNDIIITYKYLECFDASRDHFQMFKPLIFTF
jgi:hypothetical protein